MNTPNNLPANKEEVSALDPTTPEGVWLRGMNPTIFTPYTWQNGGSTTIRLRSYKHDFMPTNIARIIDHYDNGIELSDELYQLLSGTEAGHQKVVGKFKYRFTLDGSLVDVENFRRDSLAFNKTIQDMQELVTMQGATAVSSKYDWGVEASFTTDGQQWIEDGVAGSFAIGKMVLPKFLG